MIAYLQFIHSLGIWIVLIFLATLIGCYMPEWILRQREWCDGARKRSLGSGDSASETTVLQHPERNEIAMSYLMSFSAGVCLAVAFVFMINGFSSMIIDAQNAKVGGLKAGLITCATFNLFFVIEQVGSVLRDWHIRSCAGIAPCAVEVASAPLEAANVVRALYEHSNMRREALKCFPGALSRQQTHTAPPIDITTPLLDNPDFRRSASGSCNYCQANNNEIIRPYALNVERSSSVLTFLLVLFGIHSLTEGLGLGAAATPGSAGQAHAVALAILLHKTLSAFAVGASLLRAQVRAGRFGLISCLFALMSPLGALLGFTICRNEKSSLSSELNGWFSLIAAGTFLFVSLVEFLPTSFKEGDSSPEYSISGRVMKIVLFCCGSAAVLGTMACEG